MKRALAVIAFLALGAPVFGASAARYIVMTRPSFTHRQITFLQNESSLADHEVREFQAIQGFAATLTEAEVAQLKTSAGVRYVSPVVERHLLDATPAHMRPATESIYQRQQIVPYGIDLVRARETWFATRGDGVNVAIIDTGIDFNHPELATAFQGGYNTYKTDQLPFDDNRHGTHCAGIIAAQDNQLGVVGVAPNARIWSVKGLDKDGFGSDETLIAAIEWVTAKKQAIGGNWIVSMSLGGKLFSQPEVDAYQKALDANILIVAAAGNSGFPFVDYPAAYPGVMAVGAVDSAQVVASFSNRGPRIDVVAPGVDVASTIPLGTGTASEVILHDESVNAAPLTGSPKGTATAPVVFSGLGQVQDFPESVRGNIAFIRRGEITFNEKVRNAKAAGARSVIIVARETDDDDPSKWTLIRPCDLTCDDNTTDKAFDWPLTLAMSYADGEKVRAAQGMVSETYQNDDYAVLSGTSMATPHVAGVAALVWSLAPNIMANDVKFALQTTAHDLGDPGFDTTYGFGLVDAIAAAKKVAPAIFGLPQPQPSTPGSRRRSVH